MLFLIWGPALLPYNCCWPRPWPRSWPPWQDSCGPQTRPALVRPGPTCSRIIVDCEVNTGAWTLMHRFNKASELLGDAMSVSRVGIEQDSGCAAGCVQRRSGFSAAVMLAVACPMRADCLAHSWLRPLSPPDLCRAAGRTWTARWPASTCGCGTAPSASSPGSVTTTRRRARSSGAELKRSHVPVALCPPADKHSSGAQKELATACGLVRLAEPHPSASLLPCLQPRILGSAQERLTNVIADVYSRTNGWAQEWARLMLTTVGRGGNAQVSSPGQLLGAALSMLPASGQGAKIGGC